VVAIAIVPPVWIAALCFGVDATRGRVLTRNA
jgi:hypothetical protein